MSEIFLNCQKKYSWDYKKKDFECFFFQNFKNNFLRVKKYISILLKQSDFMQFVFLISTDRWSVFTTIINCLITTTNNSHGPNLAPNKQKVLSKMWKFWNFGLINSICKFQILKISNILLLASTAIKIQLHWFLTDN